MDTNETVMTVDGSRVLVNLEGETLKDSKEKELTVQSIMKQACLMPLDIDKDQDATEKFELYCLAKKIHDDAKIDLRLFEVDLLKKRIGRGFTVLVVGQMMEILK